MSLDREPMKVSEALKLARNYYTEDGYNHAMRVAGYVAEMKIIPYDYRDECVALAIMHDLVEDTEYEPIQLPCDFRKALNLLTKQKDQSYKEYCKQLKEYTDYNYGQCAYYVKLADMKDHLFQKETLTDKLKEKYLEGLAELL